MKTLFTKSKLTNIYISFLDYFFKNLSFLSINEVINLLMK